MWCKKIFWVFFVLSSYLYTDSIKFNNLNNHGSLGFINMPSARFLGDSSFGFSLYSGEPDKKITATFYPYDWIEASLFYVNSAGIGSGAGTSKNFRDDGLNLKLRLKEEGVYPAIAIGFNDLAGTGLYSSEYIVASYGIDNIDFLFGAGWGSMNGEAISKNPFSYVHDSFLDRPVLNEGQGSQFELDRYFSDTSVSFFGGIKYVFTQRSSLLVEYDPTKTPGAIGYQASSSNINYAINHSFTNNLNLGISYERGNYFGIRLNYKNSFR